MSQWVNHRDANWFEDPESFLPERWLNGLSKRLPRFACFPFGGGLRMCTGNHFAVMEAVLFLSVIAQSLNVTVDNNYKMEVMPSITLWPINGLPVTIQHRNRA
ncbi:MAG TPA: cytochrome P450 [Myxococcales bacterium]|nr:cytochrome P450 [Myxococcales bacterium]HIN85874.1 cytochrome P450 [Myxococcales bacterium]